MFEDFKLPSISTIPKVALDNPFIKKYDIDVNEFYDVITNFELAASTINSKQQQLRKKYLKVLLKAIEQEQQLIINANPMASAVINSNKDNYDSLITLVKRIINLMINEIDNLNGVTSSSTVSTSANSSDKVSDVSSDSTLNIIIFIGVLFLIYNVLNK